jgi:hypothetical protein
MGSLNIDRHIRFRLADDDLRDHSQGPMKIETAPLIDTGKITIQMRGSVGNMQNEN